MKKAIIILIFLISVLTVWSAPVGKTIPNVLKPTGISIDDSQLYITEGCVVKIYDLKSLKMINQFGKEGQGPSEFVILPGQLDLILDVEGSEIMVASFGKLSFWTKNGSFINEFTFPPISGLAPIRLENGKYLTIGYDEENGKRMRVFRICSPKMEKEKTVYSTLDGFQGPGKGFNLLVPSARAVFKDKLFVPGVKDDEIDIMDLNGNKKSTIRVPWEKRAIPQSFKDDVLKYFETTPSLQAQLPFLKPILYPDHFPPYSGFFADQGILYVLAHSVGTEPVKYHKFDISNEKLLGDGQMNIRFETPIKPYAIVIRNGFLYQLVENEDEEWELISTPLQ